MGTTTVTRGYQITIPKDVRLVKKINVGDRLMINPTETSIELKKLVPEDIESYFGIWKEVRDSAAFVRKIRDESEKRLKRLGL